MQHYTETFGADDMSMTIERDKRFGIYVSFNNCLGFEMKVKTFWHAGLSVHDNLQMILNQNHYCICSQIPSQLPP